MVPDYFLEHQKNLTKILTIQKLRFSRGLTMCQLNRHDAVMSGVIINDVCGLRGKVCLCVFDNGLTLAASNLQQN
jgi:hypothetical protein